MGRGFGLAAAGAAIYGVSGFIGIPYELSQSHAIDYLLLGRRAFEVLFLMLLALGMHGFYLAWKTGFSKARSIVDSQGSDSTIR